MTKREILEGISFGRRIAEEVAELSSYFVETDQWKRIYLGEVDIVYGPKGSGKSAIYSLLIDRHSELEKRGIITLAAENPRGTPAFKDIASDPPTGEMEFVGLWKLYFVSLIGFQLRQMDIPEAKELVSVLETAELLPHERNLRGMIQVAYSYVRSIMKAESVEGGLNFDPTTGLPVGLTGKITLREPSYKQKESGYLSVDGLLELANRALNRCDLNVWLTDRLQAFKKGLMNFV